MATTYSHEIRHASTNDFDWDSFLNHTMTTSLPDQTEGQGSGGEPTASSIVGDTTQWTDMFLGDPSIDWIGLGDTLFL
jgi:hypothetical protein